MIGQCGPLTRSRFNDCLSDLGTRFDPVAFSGFDLPATGCRKRSVRWQAKAKDNGSQVRDRHSLHSLTSG
jgi:hypothetical protein